MDFNDTSILTVREDNCIYDVRWIENDFVSSKTFHSFYFLANIFMINSFNYRFRKDFFYVNWNILEISIFQVIQCEVHAIGSN